MSSPSSLPGCFDGVTVVQVIEANDISWMLACQRIARVGVPPPLADSSFLERKEN